MVLAIRRFWKMTDGDLQKFFDDALTREPSEIKLYTAKFLGPFMITTFRLLRDAHMSAGQAYAEAYDEGIDRYTCGMEIAAEDPQKLANGMTKAALFTYLTTNMLPRSVAGQPGNEAKDQQYLAALEALVRPQAMQFIHSVHYTVADHLDWLPCKANTDGGCRHNGTARYPRRIGPQ